MPVWYKYSAALQFTTIRQFPILANRLTAAGRRVTTYLEHCHAERNHQGLDNRLIEPHPGSWAVAGSIECQERLGSKLRYYHVRVASVLSSANVRFSDALIKSAALTIEVRGTKFAPLAARHLVQIRIVKGLRARFSLLTV
jgi:hypothetical protein